jgi:hypothetical protein
MTLPIFFEAPFFTRKSHIASFFMLLAQCQGVSPACAVASRDDRRASELLPTATQTIQHAESNTHSQVCTHCVQSSPLPLITPQ